MKRSPHEVRAEMYEQVLRSSTVIQVESTLPGVILKCSCAVSVSCSPPLMLGVPLRLPSDPGQEDNTLGNAPIPARILIICLAALPQDFTLMIVLMSGLCPEEL